MPVPGKRNPAKATKAAKAAKAKGKKNPAQKAPAKTTGPKMSAEDAKLTFDEKLAKLAAGSPGSTIIIDDDAKLEGLWSRPRHYISTGTIAVDAAVGGPGPGLPSGRLVEVFGPENIGKTTFLAGLMRQVQSMGGVPITVDSEHKMDLKRLATLGVDLKRMPFEQVSTIEDVFEVLKHWAPKARSMFGDDVPILFSWDSVAGTPTKAEFAAGTEQKFQAEAAKVLKQQFRACAQIIAQTQVLFVVTNQVYSKMNGGFYGPETETYGGGAIKYHATIRIGLRFAGQLKPPGAAPDERVAPVGQIVEAKVIKNQIAPPWRWRKYALRYTEGIDNIWSLFEELRPLGVIVANGSWNGLSEEVQSALGIKTKQWQSGHFGLNALINEHDGLYAHLIKLYRERCGAT